VVLVVDDDEDLRSILVSALENLSGVRVVGAGDGVDGLQRAAQLHRVWWSSTL
jgi:CheY-like chemotaxis protein